MRAPGQRRALGALFALLTLLFAGIAFTAGSAAADGRAAGWVVAIAAAVLALWLATLAARGLRRG